MKPSNIKGLVLYCSYLNMSKLTKMGGSSYGFCYSIHNPHFSNYNYTNDQLNQFDEDYYQSDIHNKQIYTKNMFVESHYELNLSLFERDLTVKMVNDAYENILNEHMDKITKGIPDIFNITEKQEARDYLLNKLNKETKS